MRGRTSANAVRNSSIYLFEQVFQAWYNSPKKTDID